MDVMRILLVLAIVLTGCGTPPDPKWWESACGKLRVAQVGGADVAPRVIHRIDPVWPDTLQRQGIVIVGALVTAQGNVCDARVVRGYDADVDAAAIRAVKQWRFTPATKLGTPVAAEFHLTLPFRPEPDATMRPQ